MCESGRARGGLSREFSKYEQGIFTKEIPARETNMRAPVEEEMTTDQK